MATKSESETIEGNTTAWGRISAKSTRALW